ncbi:MAG: ATP-binding protein, partial [Bacillota bacterium]
MLVHRLEVRNWRGFTRDLSVELDPGLNVIAGPNESGKTSLFEALRFAFFQRADSTKQDVRGAVPKGLQLHPYVAVEFEVDGAAYRIEKTFSVRRGHTLLCGRGGSGWRPLAEDRDAEARLGEILAQDGLSQYAPALWAEQGRVLAILDSGVPGDLRTRLAQLVTGLLLTDEDRQIAEWVRSEWEQRFTRERRRPKKHSPLERALSDLAAAAAELSGARAAWAAHEQRL